MNGYVAIYNMKRVEVYADTMLQARNKAAELLKVPLKFQYRIAVCLCEKALHSPSGSQIRSLKAGEPVVHSAVD